MASKYLHSTVCTECGNLTKVPFIPDGNKAVYCPDCLAIKKGNIKQAANDLKESIKGYSKKIEFQLTTTEQKLTAVRAQGEAFASKGGVDLMITEFVENSFDAIKKRKILEALPKALKQMDFTPEFKKIAFERYTTTIIEFKAKYQSLSKEDEKNLEKLEQQILDIVKSEINQKETVIVELDDEDEQVRIIDTGTGIEYPIHICEQPFISLKTGEDYSTGKFGRGSQVFREFCLLMEFYSLRAKISKREEQNIIDDKIDTSQTDVKSIHLNFPENFPGGDYSFRDIKEYKKLSNNSGTGTVVVLSGWKENYYNELSSHLSKLERRLQHHFGFGIGGLYNIGLKIKHDKKEIEINPKDYDNESKIQGLFDLKPLQLKDKLGNPCGIVEFHIYKTTRSYNDTFKEPFLVVKGRPLGDTSIADMPSLSQYSDVWKSSFVTGYIVCNAVESNQIRIGLANTPARQPFLDTIASASIELKKQNTAWKNEHAYAMDKEMVNDVINVVTSFLSKKGLKFNFKNPLQKGLQKDLKKNGEVNDTERVSNVPGGTNQGIIDKNGEETIQLGYQPDKRGPPGPKIDDDFIIVPNGSRKKDGDEIITVKVKRSVVSKGGRKVRKSYSGPDLDFKADEDCGDELSYFEPEPPTIFIQSEHSAWQKLVKKSREQTNSEKFEKEKFHYMLERYLWEIMNNESLQADSELTPEEKQNKFWTYYHELTDTK